MSLSKIATEMRKQPQAIILDVYGVLASRQFEIFSENMIKFYKTHIDEFLSVRSQWRRPKTWKKFRSRCTCYKPSTSTTISVCPRSPDNHEKRDNDSVSAESSDGEEVVLEIIKSVGTIPLEGQLSIIYRTIACLQSSRFLLENEPSVRAFSRTSEALKEYILFGIEHNQEDVMTIFFLHRMQYWGYLKLLLETPVYDDVTSALMKWKSLGISVYVNIARDIIYNQVVVSTTQGSLKGLLAGHLKLNSRGSLSSIALPERFRDPKRVLFITHSPEEAYAAEVAGLEAVLITRKDIDPEWSSRIESEKFSCDLSNRTEGIESCGQEIINLDTEEKKEVEETEDEDKKHEDEIRLTLKEAGVTIKPINSLLVSLQDIQRFQIFSSLLDIYFTDEAGTHTGDSEASVISSQGSEGNSQE